MKLESSRCFIDFLHHPFLIYVSHLDLTNGNSSLYLWRDDLCEMIKMDGFHFCLFLLTQQELKEPGSQMLMGANRV
jgi:hypothetical protein